jgi:hypothetical protein
MKKYPQVPTFISLNGILAKKEYGIANHYWEMSESHPLLLRPENPVLWSSKLTKVSSGANSLASHGSIEVSSPGIRCCQCHIAISHIDLGGLVQDNS